MFQPLIELKTQDEELASFPVSALPIKIANYVKAVADHTQTAVDMAATISLGVLAVCLQGNQIEGTPGYYEPLSLYTVVIAEPGERKSSVMKEMTGCLYDYVAAYNTDHSKEVLDNKLQREKIERKIYSYQEELKRGENEELEIKLIELENELASIPVIKPLRLVADDCSSEALVSLLAENNGRFAVVSTEGGIFDIMTSRYSQKPNFDVWL